MVTTDNQDEQKAKMPNNSIIRIKHSLWKKYRKGVITIENASFDKDIRYSEENGDFKSFLERDCMNYAVIDSRNGENIIGYLMSSPIEHRKYYSRNRHFGKKDTMYLESIAIHPKHQGKGLGMQLFDRFLKDCKRRGKKYVIMDATSEGMRKLALKSGFSKIRSHKKWDGNRISWFMEKRI